MSAWVGDLRAPYLIGVAGLVGLYYGSAHLGFWLGFSGPVAAIVWLPVGVGISFLYLGGMQYWPGIVIGDLLVNNYTTLPLGSALGQSAGNLLEVVLATMLLRRLSASGSPLATLTGLVAMVGSLAAGTLASAIIGSTSLWIGGAVTASMWPHVFRTWMLGDFCGALLVVPLALAWAQPPRGGPWLRGRVLEILLLLGAIMILSEIALHTRDPLAYLVFPALMWAAISFDQRGATLAVLITAGFTIWGTTHSFGTFSVRSINSSVLNTQLYIVVASLSALAVAALVSERATLVEGVRESRARLVETADTERHRLERNLHDGAQQRLVALAAHLSLSAEEAAERPSEAPLLFEAAEEELLVAIEELRELAHGIHPPVLRDYGLERALTTVVARTTVPIALTGIPKTRLDATVEATAYYVMLEAITNAQKYAHASSIHVVTALTPGMLTVDVSDDGLGGAVEQMGLGLQGLRDRVEATGGHFRIESRPGHGTHICATIPATVLEPA
ncbi:MAG TPA: MASE1 domain-containing protein [Thermoleophilaceae bacterium]